MTDLSVNPEDGEVTSFGDTIDDPQYWQAEILDDDGSMPE